MLAISPESRPAYAVELAARALASIAGPLPFASANKGKNSEDPSVEEQFDR
jgi:acylglycerol lipase